MSDYDDRDYEVGKGKPPKETRWKKGQSGNPRGCPPAKRDARTMPLSHLVSEIANEKMTIIVNGRQVTLTKKEVILLAALNDALSAPAAVRIRIIALLQKLGMFDVVSTPRVPTKADRQRFLQGLLDAHDKREREEADLKQ